MKFLETLTGQRIAEDAISMIEAYRPDKGHRWHVVWYHDGTRYAFVDPETMKAFLTTGQQK